MMLTISGIAVAALIAVSYLLATFDPASLGLSTAAMPALQDSTRWRA